MTQPTTPDKSSAARLALVFVVAAVIALVATVVLVTGVLRAAGRVSDPDPYRPAAVVTTPAPSVPSGRAEPPAAADVRGRVNGHCMTTGAAEASSMKPPMLPDSSCDAIPNQSNP